MADKISRDVRSANMAKIRSTNTKPEITVRRMLHAAGYRFRVHRKDLPGKPDIVFPSRKAIVQVHGCFWHRHPDPACKDARMPKSRPEYWVPKLTRNVERDTQSTEALEALGWRVLIVWECQTSNPDKLMQTLRKFLDDSVATEC
ncbi:very short patch repair endonuclease [Brucella anthropi]|uniref:very short patch repair endonuclease n=1 Tax=Brucella anthropi TaxID=529 RepID=UPI0005697FA4|nr:very short patch repair endonuclease [Brucella anthropi]